MLVLGLNYSAHDAAATLVQDGQVIAACEEERFNREKHTKKFPQCAIQACLDSTGMDLQDVTDIALFVDPHLYYKLGFYNLFSDFPKTLRYLPYVRKQFLKRKQMLIALHDYLNTHKIAPLIHYVDHHLAHAASAFYASPFEKAAVLISDGRGEYQTISIYHAQGNVLKKVYRIKYPHSLGYLYSMVTDYLGFQMQNGEGKIMGLSSYGSDEFCEAFDDLVYFDSRSRFRLNLKYFDHHYKYGSARKNHTSLFVERFGLPRQPGEPLEQRHANIAYALQRLTEKVLIRLARVAKICTEEDYLCMAGGTALNCVANSVLLQTELFERLFVQPAANDAGTSLGAALYCYYSRSGNGSSRYALNHVFLGPSSAQGDFTNRMLNKNGLRITYLSKPSTVGAQLIHQGYVVGLFRGRMEFGPRALGNRSIIASPTNKAVVDLVNAKIKFREKFRPFAPAVLAESANDFFECNPAGEFVYPYMLASVKVKKHVVDKIPAVIHVDGTARIQTVYKETNPLFWDLINEYRKLSGIPVVLNTSFNIKGEPIVCSVEDALDSLLKSDLDYVIVNEFLLEKDKGHTRDERT